MTQMTASLTVNGDASRVVTAGRQVQTTMTQLVNSTTGVTRANRSATESASAFTQGLARQESIVEQLRLKYEPLYAATQRYDTGAMAVRQELARGNITMEQQRRLLDALADEYRQAGAAQQSFAVASADVGRSSGAVRAGVQNAAFQIQDIVVQLQSGTRASVAFSQQLPQLLGGFGALGAVLGVVLGLGIPLASTFFGLGRDASGAADEVATAADRIETAIDAIGRAQDTLNANSFANLSDIQDRYGAVTRSVLTLLQAQNQLALTNSLNATRGAVSATFDEISGTGFATALRERDRLIAEFEGLALDIQSEIDQIGSSPSAEASLQTIREELEALRSSADISVRFGVSPEDIASIEQLQGSIRDALAEEDFTALQAGIIGLREIIQSIPDGPLAELLGGLVAAEGVVRETVQRSGDLADVQDQIVNLLENGLVVAGEIPIKLGEAVTVARVVASVDVGANISVAADEAARLAGNLRTALSFSAEVNAGIIRQGVESGALPPQALEDAPQTAAERVFEQALDARRRAAAARQRAATRGGVGGGGAERDTGRNIEEEIARLRPTYARDVAAAEQWRTEALANLDATREGYAEFAADVEDIYAERLQDAYTADLERRTDWQAGVLRGLSEIEERSRDFAGTTESILTGGLDEARQAWVEWQTTGEASIDGIVDHILREMSGLAFDLAVQPAITGLFDGIAGAGRGGGGGGIGSLISVLLGRSHTGSVVGQSTVSASANGMASDERMAIVRAGQTIMTPRQLDNAGQLIGALANLAARPASGATGMSLTINNMSSATVSEPRETPGGGVEVDIMDQVEREMAGRMQRPNSPMNRSLRSMGVRRPSGRGTL